MPNMTQAKLDELIAAAAKAGADAAIAAMPAKKVFDNTNSGAVWYAKPTAEHPEPDWTHDGYLEPKCPHCDTVSKFKVWLRDGGGDGVNNKPVFRLSIDLPKQNGS